MQPCPFFLQLVIFPPHSALVRKGHFLVCHVEKISKLQNGQGAYTKSLTFTNTTTPVPAFHHSETTVWNALCANQRVFPLGELITCRWKLSKGDTMCHRGGTSVCSLPQTNSEAGRDQGRRAWGTWSLILERFWWKTVKIRQNKKKYTFSITES